MIGGMKETKFKYQEEYENSIGCFWETEPAKFVRIFGEVYGSTIFGASALDLGAGEGKNSVYLANLGASVTAIDVSPIALSRFKFQPYFSACEQRIVRINDDVRNISCEQESIDVVIAYGVFHCFDNRQQIYETIDNIKGWIKPNGYFIGATFTDKIPPPIFQDYLEYEAFLQDGELRSLFSEFDVLEYEESTITETHSTSKIEHQHSISRIIAQKRKR